MKTAWIAGVASLTATVAAASAAAGPTITPQIVRRSIQDHGARRTINDLQKKGRWETVTDAMDAGKPAWIALAPLLASGSDAGSAEDLGLSLAFALPTSPQAVLAALDMRNGHILNADRVCGRPFIEDTEPRNYRIRSVAALARVHAPSLLARKQACLKALNNTRS